MPHDWTTHNNSAHKLVVTTVQIGERLTKAADRFLKPFRLTVAQFNFLTVLMSATDGLPQTRIGDRLVVSRANVTGIVRRLKSRGLVQVERDPTDSRLKKVSITPAGARLVRRIEGPYFAEIDRVASGLKPGEAESVSLALTKLAEGL
ncbi:MAG TPA: MarR family transcriptional regulator [Planctomycetota bacterium]|jgi:MarR family 2-MHQ and catechol resistance regulon transcriptional repressor|nr:MarR family transcriptional regulator [Planctomycetota bacterium]